MVKYREPRHPRVPSLSLPSLPSHLVALLIYTALASIATWPLLLHLPTHFPAIPGELSQDVWQHAWNLWWVREALFVEQTNPYHTIALFYPQGASLYLHSLNLPLGLIGSPLLPLFGIIVTYNLLTLLVLVLTSYSTFLLARHISGHAPASTIAGVIVLCSPQRLMELRGAQLATLSDYGVPLVVLAVLAALHHRTWRIAAVAAGALLLTGLSKWYHLFHAFLVLAPLLGWYALRDWHLGGRPALRKHLGTWSRIAVMGTLAMAPFVGPAAIESMTTAYARKSDELVFSADVVRLLHHTPGVVWQPLPPDWWSPHIFAVLPLVLSLVGLVVAPRVAGIWAVLAGICLVLSLGPHLVINGENTGIPLPYALFRVLPIVDTLRAPVRINGVTTMMVGLVAAVGVARLLRSLPSGRAWLLVGVLIVLIAAETLRFPFPLTDATVSPFYEQIAAEPGEWSVLELPLSRFDRDRLEMYAQTFHGKYILTGLVSRSVPHMPQEAMPPIARADAASNRPDIITLSDAQRDQLLRSLRVRYLVVHETPSRPEQADQQVATARRTLGPLSRVYANESLRAYRLDAVAAWLDGPGQAEREEFPLFPGLDERWPPLEADGPGLTRWLPPDGAGLWVYTPRPRRVALELSLYSLPGARPLELWLNGQHQQTLPIPAGHWLRRYVSAPLPLPAGPSLIELHAPGGGSGIGSDPGPPAGAGASDDPRPLSFSIHHIALREVE